MEAVPRLPMLSFDLRVSVETADFAPKLKQYIRSHYNEDPELYSKEINQLEGLRSAAVRPAKDVTGCSTLKRYYCQLHFLASRFPMYKDGDAAVKFSWKDLYTNMVCSLADISLEMVSVLYNIGALHSQLGASDNRTTTDGMKMSCTHFQCAAWAFQHVREEYPQAMGLDLSPDMMSFMYHLCLAQAQECILEKSMMDNRKAMIVAKVAVQTVDYYKQALKLLTECPADDNGFAETISSKLYKKWEKYLKFKVSYHGSIALLFQGQQSEEQQKMGERVAYYQAAFDKLEEAKKLSKNLENMEAVNEALTFVNDVVEGKRKAAKNENEFIYHEEIPNIALLSDVKGAPLVKGIPFNINDGEVSGPDIFARIVPMKAHESSSLYSEEKAKLLRKIGTNIESKDEELEAFLSTLQLDELNVKPGNRLPQELVDKCAALSAKPDAIQNLVEAMNNLSDIYQDVEAMLTEINELLAEEERKEKEYQQIVGKRPPSILATDLTREGKKYQEAHAKASESNQTLHKAMVLHIANLKTLLLPLKELEQQIPSVVINSPEAETAINEMQHLMNKVEEMKQQRIMLANQLRESVCQDDITRQVVTYTGECLQTLFQQELQKHHRHVQLIEKNLSAQDNILKAVKDAYARCGATRKLTGELFRRRESTIASLIASYDAYEDLISKSSKGLHFYKKLEKNVGKLLQRVKGTCKVQDEEREQMMKSVKGEPTPEISNNSGVSGGGLKLKDYLNMKKETGKLTLEYPSPVNPYYNNNNASEGASWVPSVRPAPVGSEETDTKLKTDYQNYNNQNYYQEEDKLKYQMYQGNQYSNPQQDYSYSNPKNYYSTPAYSEHNPYGAGSSYTNSTAVTPPVSNSTYVPQNPTFYAETSVPNYQGTNTQSYSYSNPTTESYDYASYAAPPQSEYYANTSEYIPNQYNQTVSYNPTEIAPWQQNYTSDVYSSGSPSHVPSSYPTASPSHVPAATTNTSAMSSYPQPYNTGSPSHIPSASSYPVDPQSQFAASQSYPASASTSQTYLPASSYPAASSTSQTDISTPSYLMQSYPAVFATSQTDLTASSSYPTALSSHPAAAQSYATTTQPYPSPAPSLPASSSTPQPYPSPAPSLPAYSSTPQPYPPSYPSQEYFQTGNESLYTASQTPNNYAMTNSDSLKSPDNPTTPDSSQYYSNQYGAYAQTDYNTRNPSTYMVASTDKRLTSITYSSNDAKSSPSANRGSNVDLLAGLDFNVNQSPLTPETKREEPKVEMVEKAEAAAKPVEVVAAKKNEEVVEEKKLELNVVARDVKEEKGAAKETFMDGEALKQFASDVEKYEKFVEGLTLKTLNGPTCLDLKWKELTDLQDKSSHQHIISVARCYPMKNRFPDILPYDDSRVELPSTKDDYINASKMKDLTKSTPPFILTQAPLPSTDSDFWAMVYEQQVEVIICLVNDSELDGHIYWPTEKGQELEKGKLKISLQSSNIRNNWVERILSLCVVETRATRVVVHLQFTAWPGSSFPASPGPFLSFTSECVNFFNQQRSYNHPVVVHCISGVGRTGLFCLTVAAMMEITTGKGIPDLVTITARMSQFRKNCLRDREHLKFAYQAVLYFSQDLLMKRGILTSRSTFEDKKSKEGKCHTRHPSEDFLLGPPTDLSQLQSGIEKLGFDSAGKKNEPEVKTLEVRSRSACSRRSSMTNSCNSSGRSSPSSLPPDVLSTLDPAHFTLKIDPNKPHKPVKKKFTPESFMKKSQSNFDAFDTSSDDPLSRLDPLWTMKK